VVNLVVFDIDGTLVDSGEFDGQLYAQAIRDVVGVEVDRDWSRYKNVTDSGILDEILAGHQLAGDKEEIHSRVRREFIRLMRMYIEYYSEVLREIPGAKGLVDLLLADEDFYVAVATGGWRETAAIKLRGIGLDASNISMATASDSTNRCEIIKIAERRATNGESAVKKTYFGDGVWDKDAAAELNYDFIAVGNAVAHHQSVADLSDHAAIFALLSV
jgi:phosphoglycolate phosphatase-like HAD superfamily hydrolase